jgi:hypothetical protein
VPFSPKLRFEDCLIQNLHDASGFPIGICLAGTQRVGPAPNFEKEPWNASERLAEAPRYVINCPVSLFPDPETKIWAGIGMSVLFVRQVSADDEALSLPIGSNPYEQNKTPIIIKRGKVFM